MLAEFAIDFALAEGKTAVGRDKFATPAEIGQRFVVTFAAVKIKAAIDEG
jgi:hypothetical protein